VNTVADWLADEEFEKPVWSAFGAYCALMFYCGCKPGHMFHLPPNPVEVADGHYWVIQTGAERGPSIAGDLRLPIDEAGQGFPLTDHVDYFATVRSRITSITLQQCAPRCRIHGMAC
jgi:hypothetical protein